MCSTRAPVITIVAGGRSRQRILLLIVVVVMEENTAPTAGDRSRDDEHGKANHGLGVVTLKHKVNAIGGDREGDAQELKEVAD